MPALLSHLRTARAALAFVACCHIAPSFAAAWREPVEVVYDGTGSPRQAAEVDAALRYVMAAWSSRVDLPMHYSDAQPGPGYQAGRIVIRWVDALEQLRSGASLLGVASTRRWTWTATQTIAGAEIRLHVAALRQRDSDCFTHALLHEFGHALGIAHMADPTAVMHESLGSCHHTLTAADVAAAPYPQHPCHAELLPDFSIYLPLLKAGERTYSARLRHAAGTWSIEDYREVRNPSECRDSRLEDGILVLDKLWSPARVWRAELMPVNGSTLKLLFAL